MHTQVIKDLNAFRGQKRRRKPAYFVLLQLEEEPILLYCGLIKPQLVGDSYVQCLHIIQFPPIAGHQIFDNVFYIPVEKIYFKVQQ
jgi:hypothetical protein